ncbi:DUF1836 domain-containing protein [Clostridium tyrobutyricum]|nr:DUF1836 domain-containing protein [Clostridium tyrobutyricum]MBV4447192.1 DUF1836 domain-containing protein [Clostridium tyrobutyricum]
MEGSKLKKSEFDMEYVKNAAEEISKNTIIPYEDLPRYDLFLSQVIDYLNDKFSGEKYTNNIVQNYVKNEVISKPVNGKKRGYTKDHLAQLVLLSYMRPILSTEEIKKVFRLAFNEINDGEDDIISWEKAYKVFSYIQKDSFKKIIAKDLFDKERLNNMIKDMNLKSNEEEERIVLFFSVMSLICQASSIKNLVHSIVSNYEK